jgi:hypothetical protein
MALSRWDDGLLIARQAADLVTPSRKDRQGLFHFAFIAALRDDPSAPWHDDYAPLRDILNR